MKHDISTHRNRAIEGLTALTLFLEADHDIAPLNEASPLDVTYCVLEKDQDKAAKEFATIRGNLRSLEGFYSGAQFEEKTRYTSSGSVQHTTSLIFGGGTVRYTALWIEKGKPFEDVPLPIDFEAEAE